MSRNVFYIVATLLGMFLAGCGAPEMPARAESLYSAPSPTLPDPLTKHAPVSTPAPPVAPANGPAIAPANMSPRSSDSLEQLKAQLKEIAAEPVLEPASSTPVRVAAPSTPADPAESVDELRGEVKDLRREVARLQETVDAALAYLVGELGDENKRLKRDIASPAEIEQGNESAAAVPADEIAPPSPPLPHVDYGKEGYLMIKEWGRTPEQAKKLGGNVSSLRGIICAVPPGSTDDNLRAVAKKLKALCVGYDNVSIDVFDDEVAARDFVDKNVKSTGHYVMNILRHKATGQDVTVFVRADGAREVFSE